MVAGLMLLFASKSKSPEPLLPWEPGGFDSAGGPSARAVVAFGEEQFGEEPAVGELLLLRGGDNFLEAHPHGWEAQRAAGLVDGGVRCLLGHPAAAPGGWGDRGCGRRAHDTAPCVDGAAASAAVEVRRWSSSS